MADKNVITRNISIYPEQDALLVKFARQSGLGNVSAGMRYIINEWAQLTGFDNSGEEGLDADESNLEARFIHSPSYPENDMVDEAEVA